MTETEPEIEVIDLKYTPEVAGLLVKKGGDLARNVRILIILIRHVAEGHRCPGVEYNELLTSDKGALRNLSSVFSRNGSHCARLRHGFHSSKHNSLKVSLKKVRAKELPKVELVLEMFALKPIPGSITDPFFTATFSLEVTSGVAQECVIA